MQEVEPLYTWNYTRDANVLNLDQQQCHIAFLQLFSPLDHMVRLHKSPSSNIKIEILDKLEKSDGYVRAMIYDQQLYIIKTGKPIYSRTFAILSQIHRALVTSPERIADIEFVFNVDDQKSPLPHWTFSRKLLDTTTWLIPDFGFWAWPEARIGSYVEMRAKAEQMEEAVHWESKLEQVLWRGTAWGYPIRERLLDATYGRNWADVRPIQWSQQGGDRDIEFYMSIEDHCRYKYLLYTEGKSASGRLKYLQLCKSVILAHSMDWVTHYSHLMKNYGPEQNYFELNKDWHDIESKIRHLQGWDSLADRMAKNSVQTFRERYLTPAAEVCYWRRLFKGWSEVVAFEPEFYEKDEKGKKRWRGKPFESYLLERMLGSGGI